MTSSLTVMIVDDNPRMRAMIRSVIESDGVSICECADGVEAVANYPSVRPDWVLMDVEMKSMNGFEASAAILHENPDANIVIVTQYDDPKFREKAERIGTRNYVLKERLVELNVLLNLHSPGKSVSGKSTSSIKGSRR